MEYYVQFQNPFQFKARRYILIVGTVAITFLLLQSLMLPYGNALKSLHSDTGVVLSVKSGFPLSQLSAKSAKEGELNPSDLVGALEQDDNSESTVFIGVKNELERMDRGIGKGRDKGGGGLVEDKESENEISALKFDDIIQVNSSLLDVENIGHIEKIAELRHENSSDRTSELSGRFSSGGDENVHNWNLAQSDLAVFGNNSEAIGTRLRKKVRPGMPPISITPMDKMNRILARHIASSIKVRSQWSSLRNSGKEILDAKLRIINGAASNVDKELYAPVFRNVSMFMRSYELMEKTLKVYVYMDGEKPIFHQPILKGLYASEGWFMKLMEGNKHFIVKNPEKAHLFYMPFSSRMLEYALYVPNSHNRTSLRRFVKEYKEAIAAKYPFWNRTGGTDHFLVACHDWAPYETRHHMENSIKALCNADVTVGFKIGRDVSLPETFIRYSRNPVRGIGGKPPSKRNILAFYAGNSHGYLRPILLKYWKDKDPRMRIYGLLPARVSRKMSYIQHMKSSKYCICPKGFEVNRPRVVEAIFYECVPVIISDNFVPPFFEVLNWEAFSVILAEKDIPSLKDILLAIPEEKYIQMQVAVRKVQQHFLWHARPVRYDLFHMTLHSIWYSRVFQVRRR